MIVRVETINGCGGHRYECDDFQLSEGWLRLYREAEDPTAWTLNDARMTRSVPIVDMQKDSGVESRTLRLFFAIPTRRIIRVEVDPDDE